TREKYLRLCARARELCPDIELATDLIVGFPGETTEEYLATRSLVEEVRFKQIYVFKYSPRPGTAAAALADDVPDDQKLRRNNDLLDLHDGICDERNQRLVGRETEVLVDGPSDRGGHLVGRTDGNHATIFDGDPALAGEFVKVRVTRATASALYGELVPGT